LNLQWLLNDILKPFKEGSSERKTVGFDRAE
jgi:hypothetical protein